MNGFPNYIKFSLNSGLLSSGLLTPTALRASTLSSPTAEKGSEEDHNLTLFTVSQRFLPLAEERVDQRSVVGLGLQSSITTYKKGPPITGEPDI